MLIRAAIIVVIAVVVAAATFVLVDHDEPKPPHVTLSEVMPDVSGADPRLVKISDQANTLLPGGKDAYDARIESLKGLPIVVNKWAEWCVPCKAEVPTFQKVAKKYGGTVAFLGVNADDSNAKAKRFLFKYPMPYPSYVDKNLAISQDFPPPGSPPVTNIYDTSGRLVRTYVGQFRSAAELEATIQRYAGPIKAGPSG